MTPTGRHPPMPLPEPADHSTEPPPPAGARRALQTAAAVALVLAALVLAWQRAPSGLPYLHDWDEPVLTGVALDMMKTGRANPELFHYGSLPYALLVGVDAVCFLDLARRMPPAFPQIPDPIVRYSRLDLDSIRTVADTGWLWEISHPEFVLWNRRTWALLGAVMVALAVAVGWRLGGPGAGLLGAALLTVAEPRVERSSLVNADLPMAVFALLASWLALRWLESRRRFDLVACLIAAAWAAACKPNGGLVLLAPVAALLAARVGPANRVSPTAGDERDTEGPGVRELLLLVLVPPIAFLVASPYALLDLPTFLADFGFEIHHYAAAGHAAVDVPTGWPHLRLELGRMAGHLGWIPLLLSGLGLGVAMRHPARAAVAFGFPVAYLLITSGTHPTFHRNVLVVYPYAAVAAAVGGVALWERLVRRIPPQRRGAAGALAISAAVAWCLVLGVRTAERTAESTIRETRSQAVDEILRRADARSGPTRVGLSAELRVHPRDIARLEAHPAVEVVERSHLELVCEAPALDLLVTGGTHAALWPSSHSERALRDRLGRGAHPENMPRVDIESPVRPRTPTQLDGLSRNPWIVLQDVDRSGFAAPRACGTGAS